MMKHVLDGAASNIDALFGEIHVSTTQLTRPLWNKMSLSPP
jgi:hypothetical protein